MSALTLDEVERLLAAARTPAEAFAKVPYRDLARLTHPDRNPGDPRAAALFRRVQEFHDRLHAPKPVVTGPKRRYTVTDPLATGDVANVFLATGDPAPTPDTKYVVKVARVPDAHRMLDRERESLTTLLTAAGDATYRKYVPTLAESFPVRDGFPRRVNVFLHEGGFYTLDQVHARHPALDAKHLAWVFKRMLTVLGFAHRNGLVHGAFLPPHMLLHPEGHGLKLVGWGQSVPVGEPLASVATAFRAWYPPEVFKKQPATAATDIFLAARCVVHLAGGDATADEIPDAVPAPFARFLRSCLLPGAKMRPGDAWKLLDEFDELLRGLYGPPRFHELRMD